MTNKAASSVINEMVPLAQRLLCMQLVRTIAALLVVAYALGSPSVGTGATHVIVEALAYVALSGVIHALWHVSRKRNVTVFGTMLITDGFFLCWVAYGTGGSTSPVRWLAVLHVMTVALLASYRTAMKLAVWHSLLAIVAYRLVEGGYGDLLTGGARMPGSEHLVTICFIVATWLAAVGTATFAATNERELRRRKVDLEELARMATALEHVVTPVEVATTLRDTLVGAYAFPRLEVVGAGPDGYFHLNGDGAVPDARCDDLLRKAFDGHETQLVEEFDPERDPLLCRLMPDARNVIVVPLFADGAAIGAVVAEHGVRRGSRVERRVVAMTERFCAHAALALRNAWLLEELQKVAATDGLTGLANRRTFEQALAREAAAAERTGEPFSLLLLDIDFFKRLNDTYGHRTGDLALQNVATVLAGEARGMDLVARYGGEEFGIIVPSTGSAAAAAMGERLRLAVEGLRAEPHMTVSVGVASFPRDGGDPEAVVRAADLALYEAKRLGRNTVVVAAPVGPTAVSA